jgi:hypothetical protein
MDPRRLSARETPSRNQNRHRAHGAALRTPQCARQGNSQGLIQPFSHNQTGTLLIRQLAHFVSAIDSRDGDSDYSTQAGNAYPSSSRKSRTFRKRSLQGTRGTQHNRNAKGETKLEQVKKPSN